MSSNGKAVPVRWFAALALVAALGVVVALAAPAVRAQEQPAPSTPEPTERAQELAEKAEAGEGPEVEAENITKAVAILYPTAGSNVRGVVTFTKVDDGVRVVAHIEGLTPGQHGFHVHEWGDCTAADAASAGGHYNPNNKPHAGPDAEERHEGDLGNVEAADTGVAHYDRVDKELNLNGEDSIIGRSVLVHGNPDDLTSQPAGNAGPRFACGVVGIVKP